MDPNFILKYLPELMIEQGGSRVGTMAATFMQSGAGRMTKRALEENMRLGLIDPSKLEFDKGKLKRIGEGAWQNESDRYHNPAKWALETLAPALQKQGIDPFSRGNPRLVRELAMLFSDRNAQKFMEQLLLHKNAMQRFAERTDRARLDYERQRSTNPSIALEGLAGSWATLRAALGDNSMMTAIPIINGMADAMSGLGRAAAEHPHLTHLATSAGMELGGVAAGLIALGAAARGAKWALAGVGLGAGGSAAANAAAAATGAFGRGAGAGGAASYMLGGGGGIHRPGAPMRNLIPRGLRMAGKFGGVLGLLAIGETIAEHIGDKPDETEEWLRSYSSPGSGLRTLTDRWIASTNGSRAARTMMPELPFGSFRDRERLSAAGGFMEPGTVLPIPAAGGSGDGGGHIGALVGAVQQAVGALEAAAGRSVTLTGEATFNGNVTLNMGELGAAVAQMVARGVAHAASGAMTSGPAREHWSGGISHPPPT
jgi:hypothetical protein